MESSTLRTEEEIQRQLEIRKQIKRLQAQLSDGNNVIESPKRNQPRETMLAPATPSPSEYALCILELLPNER
jgi:minichromosome maintenance protein 10